ncbi:MAG: sigma-54 interaction domain-containing protein [Candidatus Longimicrobiales bacterium M2_2A_002]
MDPLLSVLQATDAFTDVWPDLADAAGVRLETGAAVPELAPLREAVAVLVVLAGSEEEAPEVVSAVRSAGGDPIAVVAAETGHRLAVQAVGAGAVEYFALPGDTDALWSWVQEQADRARADERARALAEEERDEYDFSRLIGESAGLHKALTIAARVIPRGTSTVLITGETGTGKELLAQAIHYNGPRASEPFIEVNCTALPANLLEAELFGYEQGAFTDARTAKPGLFEAAHGGTLFLDEIGDLSLDLQAKLLRVLEEKRVRRLGSLRSVDVDVRILAATHVDLQEAIAEGTFREDLYYRLGVVPVHLPPLRERGEDVLLLAEHFLDTFAEMYDVERPPLDREAREALLSYRWPGNIRELRNGLERVILLGDGSFDPENLFLAGRSRAADHPGPLPFPAPLDDIVAAAARAMVERTDGNKSAAAEALGISRSRLYRLLGEGD